MLVKRGLNWWKVERLDFEERSSHLKEPECLFS